MEQPSIHRHTTGDSKDGAEQNSSLVDAGDATALPQSTPAFGIVILVAWLVGNATFGAPFSHIHIGPIYITEILLALLLLVYLMQVLSGSLPLPQKRSSIVLFVLVTAYISYGACRLLIGLLLSGEAPLELLRNFGLVHYSVFVFVGFFAVAGPPAANRIVSAQWAILVSCTIANTVRTLLFFSKFGAVINGETKVLGGDVMLYSMVAVIFLWALLLDPDRKIGRSRAQAFILWGLLPLNFVYVWLSGHRSALIALAAAILVVQMARGESARAIRLVTGGAIAIALAATLIGTVGASIRAIGLKYLTLATPTQEADSLWRALFWRAVLHLWGQALVFGVGFSYNLEKIQPWATGTPGERGDPHNSYLSIGVRMGLLGISLVLAIFACYFFTMLRTARRGNSQIRLLSSVLLGEFVAIAVFASMNVVLEGPFEGGLLWMCIGMGLAVLEQFRATIPKPAVQSRYAPYPNLLSYAAAVACHQESSQAGVNELR